MTQESLRRMSVAALLIAMAGVPRGGVARPLAASGPSADTLVSQGVARARAEGKAVLIEFGASWCTWCRRFEAFVASPEVGRIVQNNYVIVNLTVQEREEKKALETPGGDARMRQWGGENAGLPFYVFLDGTGRKVADSKAMPDGANIGFPGTAKEADAFMALIAKTAPRLRATDRQQISAFLQKSVQP